MTPLEFELAALALAVAAGTLGALLGLGGGIVVVPALTVLLGVDIRYAIGASIVSVIATSLGATRRYLRDGMVHVRLALVLELATVAGALAGASLAGLASARTLHLAFALVAVVVGVLMLRRWSSASRIGDGRGGDPDPLGLAGTVVDEATGQAIAYRPRRLPAGLAMSGLAGTVSGLLGVGGGFLKVPAMNVAMAVPLKVSTATSNFMIGMTAAASATVFFRRGDIAPLVAAPVAIGVLIGAALGTRLHRWMPARALRLTFVVVLTLIAGSMAWKGLAP